MRSHVLPAARSTGAAQLTLFGLSRFAPVELGLPLDRHFAHTNTLITVVPGGAVIASRCVCGGDHKVVIGPEVFAGAAESTEDEFPDALGRILGDLPRRLTCAWRESHRQCAAVRSQVLPTAQEDRHEHARRAAVRSDENPCVDVPAIGRTAEGALIEAMTVEELKHYLRTGRLPLRLDPADDNPFYEGDPRVEGYGAASTDAADDATLQDDVELNALDPQDYEVPEDYERF